MIQAASTWVPGNEPCNNCQSVGGHQLYKPCAVREEGGACFVCTTRGSSPPCSFIANKRRASVKDEDSEDSRPAKRPRTSDGSSPLSSSMTATPPPEQASLLNSLNHYAHPVAIGNVQPAAKRYSHSQTPRGHQASQGGYHVTRSVGGRRKCTVSESVCGSSSQLHC